MFKWLRPAAFGALIGAGAWATAAAGRLADTLPPELAGYALLVAIMAAFVTTLGAVLILSE